MEVGKFYKCNLVNSSPYIIEILCVGNQGSYVRVIESSHGISPKESEFKLNPAAYMNWVEYTPPKKYCIDIYSDGYTNPSPYLRKADVSRDITSSKPSSPLYKFVKTIEIEL